MSDRETDNSDYHDEDEYNDREDEAEMSVPPERKGEQEEANQLEDGDDKSLQLDLDNITIDEKNKPRCSTCLKVHKAGTYVINVLVGCALTNIHLTST